MDGSKELELRIRLYRALELLQEGNAVMRKQIDIRKSHNYLTIAGRVIACLSLVSAFMGYLWTTGGMGIILLLLYFLVCHLESRYNRLETRRVEIHTTLFGSE